MIGIIVAAGKGTRIKNPVKSMLVYKGKRLIAYPLEVMKKSRISRVIIIQHGNLIEKAFGTFYKGMSLEYVQQKQRRGIAHAIGLTKEKVGKEDVCVILGDIVYSGNLLKMKSCHRECTVGFQSIKDRELIKKSFGVTKKGDFIEKPKKTENLKSLLGLGIYMFNSSIFDCIKKTKPGINNETQITDTLNQFNKVKISKLPGKYINVNEMEDLE